MITKEKRYRAVLVNGKAFPKNYSTPTRLIKAIKNEGLKTQDIFKIEEFEVLFKPTPTKVKLTLGLD
jgi:hypothetical protein